MPKSSFSRREFLQVSTGAAAATLVGANPLFGGSNSEVKPIRGSWISVLWDDRRHFYWNEAYRKFTAAQWRASVAEVADLGMEYLVLLAVAKGGKALLRLQSPSQGRDGVRRPDQRDALGKPTRLGVKFFISSDWYGEWDHAALVDADRVKKTLRHDGRGGRAIRGPRELLRLVLAERGLPDAVLHRTVHELRERLHRPRQKTDPQGQNAHRSLRDVP